VVATLTRGEVLEHVGLAVPVGRGDGCEALQELVRHDPRDRAGLGALLSPLT